MSTFGPPLMRQSCSACWLIPPHGCWLEWLIDLVHGGEFVLDVEAGSGILGMASLRLGAASALGVECDPVAVDCARHYAEENGFGDHLEFRCGTLEEVDRHGELRPYLVFANL